MIEYKSRKGTRTERRERKNRWVRGEGRREKGTEENSRTFGEWLVQLLSPSFAARRQIIFLANHGRDENGVTEISENPTKLIYEWIIVM